MLLAKNIEAGRLIAGITEAEPGHWTSWPPHEHAAMLEEIFTPIPYIIPAQLFAACLADQKGLDPDRPRTLSKVTRTM